MRPGLASLLSFALLSAPVAAEEAVTLDLSAVLAIAEAPWRDRATVLELLQAGVGGFEADRAAIDVEAEDPWLWSITGEFGTARRDLHMPGGILACSRYGIDTRDRLAGADLSSPQNFALLGVTMAAHDDAEVWPEAAVARLACSLTWDDTRRVGILPLDRVLPVLSGFDEVTVGGDPAPVEGRAFTPLYGPDGYRVMARGGLQTPSVTVEHMRVDLRVTHQRVSFRSFLLGGGV